MRTFAQNTRATQQATFSKSTIPGRARFGQNCEMNSAPTLQRSIGNQAVQHLLAAHARDVRGDSPATENPRFGHDFSRIAVNDSQARARTAPKELASLRPCDMEGVEEAEGAEELDQAAGVPMPAPSPAAPPAPSPAAPPAPIPVPAPVAALNVTVPPHVRSASTPKGMPDRIPPRVDTPVTVGITGWHPPTLGVTLSLEGAGGGNGSATINGAPSVNLVASTAVNMRGVDQTDPGKAGGLRLVARQGPTVLASSGGFSVSSIPQNFYVTFNSQISTPTMRGLQVNNHWLSDSGNVADLDQAERTERVQYGAATGIWSGVVGGNNSGYLPANNPPLVDSHGTPLARLTGPGSRIAEQTFTFNDKRTGAVDIPATNSGFRLTRTAVTNPAGRIEFTVDKRGATTSANGFASAAGAGSVTRTQVI